MSEELNILNGGVETPVTLAEIADLDVSDVEISFGGFAITPKSTALWVIKDMGVKSFGEHIVVQIECECEKCYAVKSEEFDETTMIGFKHNESIFLKDLAKDLGLVKGFLERIGMTGVSKLDAAMDAATGMKFVANITHSRNKDDPDKPWVNMDIKGILSQEVFETSIA